MLDLQSVFMLSLHCNWLWHWWQSR